MKPRLKKIRLLWYCWVKGSQIIGCGYTPKHAYDVWLCQVLGVK